MRILIVEDDPLVLTTLFDMLILDGHQVKTALNGREGLKQFCSHFNNLDLVISDFEMPLLNGAQWRQEAVGICDRIPFIFLSGKSKEACFPNGLPHPGDWFISKPVSLYALVKTLTHFEQSQTTPESTYSSG